VTARQRALGGLALLVFAMFVDTLVLPGPRVLGFEGGDMTQQFLPWREFGFGELAKGNLALWNPHIFAGAPYFGGMQSALLYPPNWLFLVLPLPLAVNWTIAVNLWLLGALTYLWASRRRLHPFAAFVSGALAMFCAPSFLHVMAGHLANLSSMAWIPLQFLAIDEWLARRKPVWCLVGMLAVAMEIFGGHPQYVYFAGIASGIYALTRLAEPQQNRIVALAGVLSIPVGGALLAAVQLLAGVQATHETVRALPLPIWFAGSIGFPPENLLTLLAPGFFGDYTFHPYWGRWYFWETCAFVGVSGLALACYGIATVGVTAKRALLLTLVLTLVLAFGDNSPLFGVLYHWFPFYDRFRGSSKFIFFVALILCLLAGHGLDRILRERAIAQRALIAAAAAAVVLVVGGSLVSLADGKPVMNAMYATGQTYLSAATYANPTFVAASRSFAGLGLLLAGVTLAVATVLALWVRRDPRAVFFLGALAVAEVFAFARMQRPTFDASKSVIPQLREYLASHPGDYRTLNLWMPNMAMSMGTFDAWGYDPGVTRRYAELMAWSQGEDPDQATQYMTFRRFGPLLTLLRVKYIVMLQNHTMRIFPGSRPPLAHLVLVGGYQVHAKRGSILRSMGTASFDPRKEVILEQEPDPAPVAEGGAHGRATIVREGTDFMDIEADLQDPAILLVTDAWADGWRAVPLGGSSQSSYRLVPADYALRAVALGRGHHHLRIEYAPRLFYVGVVVSALAWPAWLLVLWILRRRNDRARSD
jgi:hypothetical protein